MLWLDFETFSEVPIKHGTYRYAAACEVLIATYALDEGPIRLWDRTLDTRMPGDLAYALGDASELVTAHFSMFDRNVMKHALGIEVPIPRWRDTMVRALAHSLPGGLDKLCEVLNVPRDQAKLKDGKKLIQLFCKPRAKGRATRETHPEQWARFCDYAVADITAMREIARRLPEWNYGEEELVLWHLDQRVNDRGFRVDQALVEAAIDATARAQERLSHETCDLTAGEVTRATQRDRLLQHIVESYGVMLPDLKGDTIERRLGDEDLPAELRELLRVRLQATMSSTSKYKSLANGVSADGRLRGTIQFNGASRTGRDAGRTFQPQNLPSRGLLPQADIDLGIEAMKLGAAHLAYDNVMHLAASAIRGCVIAPAGRKLVVADLSNIEGRYAAWLAGEAWKLQAFRDYDDGTGADLYRLAYAKAFRVPVEAVDGGKEKGPQRQIGKVMELMLQYQGGVGAYITGAETYGIDLDEMAGQAYPVIPGDVLHEAEDFLSWAIEKKRPTFGLAARTFVVCDALKRLWRRAHPAICSLWDELEDVVKTAIETPGRTFNCRRFLVRRDGAWLRIGMPSGRALCYPSPAMDRSGRITYMGINQYTKQWSRIPTYGGKLLENLTQAGARDVLFYRTPVVEAAGYEIVLKVHDEVICEAPDDPRFNAGDLSRIIATPPTWAADLPLAAAGFEATRYRKD